MNQIIYSIITEQWSEKMSLQEKNRQEPTEPNLQQNSNIQGKIISRFLPALASYLKLDVYI